MKVNIKPEDFNILVNYISNIRYLDAFDEAPEWGLNIGNFPTPSSRKGLWSHFIRTLIARSDENENYIYRFLKNTISGEEHKDFDLGYFLNLFTKPIENRISVLNFDNFQQQKYLGKIKRTQNISVLSLIEKKSLSVARVLNESGFGSGFLLSNKLFITCEHVVNENNFGSAYIDFLYENDLDGKKKKRVSAIVKSVLQTNNTLDFTLIEIKFINDINLEFDGLSFANNNAEVGEQIFLVHHPEGGIKKVSFGTCIYIDEQYLLYDADTEVGSSGGVILNGNGEIIGLHQGVIKEAQMIEGKNTVLNRGLNMSQFK